MELADTFCHPDGESKIELTRGAAPPSPISFPGLLDMKARRAVVAAAGLGTRMYPIAKTIDKAISSTVSDSTPSTSNQPRRHGVSNPSRPATHRSTCQIRPYRGSNPRAPQVHPSPRTRCAQHWLPPRE